MEKYDGVLKELAALLVPHLLNNPQLVHGLAELASASVDAATVKLATVEYVERKLDELSVLDKCAITDIVRGELENAELITAEDLDDRLADYIAEDKAEDKLQEIFTDNIAGAVRECLKREITLTVEVS